MKAPCSPQMTRSGWQLSSLESSVPPDRCMVRRNTGFAQGPAGGRAPRPPVVGIASRKSLATFLDLLESVPCSFVISELISCTPVNVRRSPAVAPFERERPALSDLDSLHFFQEAGKHFALAAAPSDLTLMLASLGIGQVEFFRAESRQASNVNEDLARIS